MLNISGWIGHAGPAPDLARESPSEPRQDAPGGHGPGVATGPGWGVVAPWVARSGDITAAIRGEPAWRTSEAAVLQAPSAAHALLEAYRLWGSGLLQRISGAFSLVVLDGRAHAALLAVDRIGIERMTYALPARSLVFATSAEFAARFPGSRVRVRPQALLSYLYFHMIPSPETLFEGVHKLPPATALEWRDGATRTFVYWRPEFTVNGGASFDSLKTSLHAALETAVEASEPTAATGAFLSGGLDSSTVTGVLARQRPEPVRTFSIGFGFEGYDELHYARIASRRFGCDAYEYVVTADDITDLFAKVARAYDEPFGNASAIPTYCCARLALQNGVSHLLAGDGGDELFAGNKRYAEQRVFEHYARVPRMLRSLLEPALGSLPRALQVSLLRKGRNYVAQARTPLPDRFENWNFLHRFGFDTVLHPELAAAVDPGGPLEHMRAVYASGADASLVDRMLYYDWRLTLADNDLRKVGTMCDLAGVRVSYPMLHQDVVDASTRVPAALKMNGTHLRTFYKRAMDGFLPAEIISKSKHGFGLPFGLWLQRSPRLAQLIDANLAGLRSRSIIEPSFIDRLRALHDRDDAQYYGVFIWTLAMLEQWFREHEAAP